MAASEVRRILVRAPNWVGDVVMATGSFLDLRASFPGAEIDFLLPASRALVLAGEPYAAAVLADEARSPPAIWRLSRDLRARGYDLAVLYPNSTRSALAPALAGIPERVGYAGYFRRWLLTRAVEEAYPRPKKRPGPRLHPYPMAERYRELARAAGALPSEGRPVLTVSPNCEERAAAWRKGRGIAPGERLIGINPGAAFGASKLWPTERFARLADLLAERTGRRIVIFVGPGEEEIERRIAAEMRSRPIGTAAAPPGLELLKPLVRDLDLLVTTDTGTRHYAVAFRVPIVVVMGPTHPGFTAAFLEETEVIRREVPCGPCHLKTCPLDHRCMKEIEVDEVFQTCLTLLAKRSSNDQKE